MDEDFCIIESENIKNTTDDNVINLVLHTLNLNKQVLIFNKSKRSAEATAEKISEHLKKTHDDDLKKISKEILNVLDTPTKQCIRLSMCIEKGIAFHHAGLLNKQREIIENEFRNGKIKVISSTPTLAAGMNLPAYKVIIKDYKRYTQRGMSDIPILEYHQMSGRAGRPGQEDVGRAVLCTKSCDETSKIVPKYIFGKTEEIISKLAIEPTLKMYLLSLISMNIINSTQEIKDFFKNTLYAHQYGDIEELYYNIFRIIHILKEYEFIQEDDNYFMATILGKKISELYLNPDTANYFLIHIENFFKASKYRKDTYALIHFIVNTIEMKPLFNILKSEEETYMKRLEELSDTLTVKFDPFEHDLHLFLNSIKTTDILEDWINEHSEDYITSKYNITPGELKYKQEIVDWLLYCIETISAFKKEVFFKNYITKLRNRFKYGIREELLALVSLKGIGRVRARNLFKNGIKDVNTFLKTPNNDLEKFIPHSIIINIKEEFGILHEEKNKNNIKIQTKQINDDEVNKLIKNYDEYEQEKKEKNSKLTDFF